MGTKNAIIAAAALLGTAGGGAVGQAHAATVGFDGVTAPALYGGAAGSYTEGELELSTAGGYLFPDAAGEGDGHLHLSSLMPAWVLRTTDGRSFSLEGFSASAWPGGTSFTLSLKATFTDDTTQVFVIDYDAATATGPGVLDVVLNLTGLSSLTFRATSGIAAIDDIVARPVPLPGAGLLFGAGLAALATLRRGRRAG